MHVSAKSGCCVTAGRTPGFPAWLHQEHQDSGQTCTKKRSDGGGGGADGDAAAEEETRTADENSQWGGGQRDDQRRAGEERVDDPPDALADDGLPDIWKERTRAGKTQTDEDC